jgi:hypothetical protein
MADLAMSLHFLVFFGAKAGRLKKYSIRDSDFTKVVELGFISVVFSDVAANSAPDFFQLRAGKPIILGDNTSLS